MSGEIQRRNKGINGSPGVSGMPMSTAKNRNGAGKAPHTGLMAPSSILTMGPYKHRKDLVRESLLSKYKIVGYIAAGTYGKVYKAEAKLGPGNGSPMNDLVFPLASTRSIQAGINPSEQEDVENEDNKNQCYAIKKFKSETYASHKAHNDMGRTETIQHTGISQSAMREMSLCRELNNKNIVRVVDIILENKSIYMVFEYCEHDLLQLIQYHSHSQVSPLSDDTIRLIMFQLLNGVYFLHQNWVFHRDLKPANIMISTSGVVKIGDLGLARKFNNLYQSLYSGDKVVVTIWYRAPELLLGARHYSPAIDLWAVGCILAELLALRPIFKGEEAKIEMNNRKLLPFQRNQLQKIVEILGTPTSKEWPSLSLYPEYSAFQQTFTQFYPSSLHKWYQAVGRTNLQCFDLLKGLLVYDPSRRLSAEEARVHPFFSESTPLSENAFEMSSVRYPRRKIHTDDSDMLAMHYMANKRHKLDDNLTRKKRK